ncbi:MAG TPA: hypothetical protein ENK57_14525 [Polyangiaceae bacterium]|nr:hypothetical protein [Polyangiaceae bacterium]
MAGATVRHDGGETTTDASGRAVVSVEGAAADFEVSAAGRVTRAILGATTERFTVVVAPPTAGTRTLTATVTGLSSLPAPASGVRRTVRVRPSAPTSPGAIAAELGRDAIEVCVVAGDECEITLDAPAASERLGVAVIDEAAGSRERSVVAFAVSDPIADGPEVIDLSAADAIAMVTLEMSPPDAVVGVPGLGIGAGQVVFFAGGSSLTTASVPGGGRGRPWLALVYDRADRELLAGVAQDPASSVQIPAAPRISFDGSSVELVSSPVSTLSLFDGEQERWRVTVLDGRARVQLPAAESGARVVVVSHGTDPAFVGAERFLIDGVASSRVP